jgi:hypothetical protein
VSLLTYGIPTSLLWLACTRHVAAVATAVGCQLVLRVVAQALTYRALARPLGWPERLLLPARDIASFLLGVLSFTGRQVRWNNERLRVDRRGRLRPVELVPEPEAPLDGRKKIA